MKACGAQPYRSLTRAALLMLLLACGPAQPAADDPAITLSDNVAVVLGSFLFIGAKPVLRSPYVLGTSLPILAYSPEGLPDDLRITSAQPDILRVDRVSRFGGALVAECSALSEGVSRLAVVDALGRSRRSQLIEVLRPDRADTIVPAVSIFLRVAELFYQGAIVAPGVGLKEGILIELVDRHFDAWDEEAEASRLLAGCTRLGQRYHFDEGHAEVVDRLASQLFDDLWDLHGLRARDRVLLRAAAILHDIGDYVRYDGHHKHSYYLIQQSDIMGLSPDERAIVANVARYHRKSLPDPAHPNFRDLDKDARAKVRSLAAILRVADALDREHLGRVEGVRGEVDEPRRRLLLHLRGEGDRELEEWTVRQKGDLLREEFGLDVVLSPARSERPEPPRGK
jgi:hypothetical protein